MRVLLTTWGSLGDLNPFLRLGAELRERGHRVTLAVNPLWRQRVETAGLHFVPCGPPVEPDEVFADPRVISARNLGLESMDAIMRMGVGPKIESTYEALRAQVHANDLLVSHHFMFAARTVAEITGIPWASVVLAPGVTPTWWQYPTGQSFTEPLGPVGRWINAGVWWLGRTLVGRIVDPVVNAHRAKHGLGPVRDVFFRKTISEQMHFLLYSEHFRPRPPDWPETFHIPGFCVWRGAPGYRPPPELTSFLAAGEKPWLFTLGTAAVSYPGNFYKSAAEASRRLGLRAILLYGKEENRPAHLGPDILALPAAPYDWLMPQCRAVAHQCGAGTVAQSLLAELPVLACPFAFDQPRNALRLRELGVAEMLSTKRREADDMVKAMQRIEAGDHAARAKELAAKLRAEDGPARTSELLEGFVKERNLASTRDSS